MRCHDGSSESVRCSSPLSETIIFWSGDLGLCCNDDIQLTLLPDVNGRGFIAAYRSDEAARAHVMTLRSVTASVIQAQADKRGFVFELTST
jgi:hypothetical protein